MEHRKIEGIVRRDLRDFDDTTPHESVGISSCLDLHEFLRQCRSTRNIDLILEKWYIDVCICISRYSSKHREFESAFVVSAY